MSSVHRNRSFSLRNAVLVAGGALMIAAGAAAHSADLTSHWGAPPPPAAPQAAAPAAAAAPVSVVTGPPFETFSKNSAFGASVQNDNQFLYLTFRVSDPAVIRQALARGLIVWFNPKGNKDRTFGIEYPIPAFGQFAAGRRAGPGGNGDASDSSGAGAGAPGQDGQGGPPTDPAGMLDRLRAAGRLDSLAILGPKKDDRQVMAIGQAPGVSVDLESDQETLEYTLKVPLASSAGGPPAIGARPASVIGIGLETPPFDRSAFQRREGGRGGFGGGRGGGFGGGHGGFGGGFGGMRGGGRGGFGGQRQPEKPLNDWSSIQLASPSAR